MNITHVLQQDSGWQVTQADGTVTFVPEGHRYEADINAWVAAGNTIETPAPSSLAEVKAAKLAELKAACDAECAPVRSAYPMAEQLSWDQQVREATAYQADSTAETPLLDEIAAAWGISVSALAGKVLTNAAAYKTIAGGAIGKRQRLEDAVKVATTTAEVEAISW